MAGGGSVIDWSLLATGMGIGVAVSAPVGPVNVMCLHRAVRHGFWWGLSAGMGAVLADAVFAVVAAFGISAVTDLIEGHIALLKLAGGTLLIVFGVGVMFSKPATESGVPRESARGFIGAATASFFLAITNPGLLFAFLAMFSGLAEFGRGPADVQAASTLVVGVVVGGTLWWVALSLLVGRFRARISDRALYLFNLVSGFILAGAGTAILVELIASGIYRYYWPPIL